MASFKTVLRWIGRESKRIAVSVFGFALVVAGLLLLVLPGPGLLVVIAGLAVLATQYAWAQRVLDEAKRRARSAARRVRRKKT